MVLGHTRRRRWAFIIALCGIFLAFASASRAQSRLIFSRGGVLYSAAENGSEPRRLFALGGKPSDTFWAVSPDGRRIAWATRALAKPGEGGINHLAARPATVYVAELLSAGQRRKRLFATDTLKDRQGKPVTAIGVPPNASGVSRGFNEWEPVSLSWSADSKTLYLSCAYWTADPVRDTKNAKGAYGIDAATGAALVDADGYWKLIAPMTQIEARGGLLVGSGIARLPEDTGEGYEHYYQPLTVINLVEGNRTPLFTASPTQTRENAPPYANAYQPALAPQNRAIAFVTVGKGVEATERGLWTVDKFGKTYRRVLEGAAWRPRWSSDGSRLLFLQSRGGTTPLYDLYQTDAPKDSAAASPGSPRLLLQNVDWFDVVPD